MVGTCIHLLVVVSDVSIGLGLVSSLVGYLSVVIGFWVCDSINVGLGLGLGFLLEVGTRASCVIGRWV